MIVRGNFENFFYEEAYPWLNHLVKQAGERPMECTKVFRTDTSDRAVEQVSAVTGVGLFSEIAESGDIREDFPLEGFPKNFRHKKYGLSIGTSREAIEDDKHRILARRHAALGRSGRETVEVQVASHINNGFSTGAYAGPDAVALFSTSHPLAKQGGVQSNTLSNAADLDVASLELALTAWETMLTEEGFPALWPSPNLVYHPSNRWNATEILESSLRSDTAQNAINALMQAEGGKLGHFPWHYLTDEDSWFLFAPPGWEGNELILWWRKKPYNATWYDDRLETGYIARRYRASSGFAHYQGTFGVQGQ